MLCYMMTVFINIISLFFFRGETTQTQILHVLIFAGQTVFAQGTSASLCMIPSSANCPSQISSHLMALGSMLMCM